LPFSLLRFIGDMAIFVVLRSILRTTTFYKKTINNKLTIISSYLFSKEFRAEG